MVNGIPIWYSTVLNDWFARLITVDRIGQKNSGEFVRFIQNKFQHISGSIWDSSMHGEGSPEMWYQGANAELERMTNNEEYASIWYETMRSQYEGNMLADFRQLNTLYTSIQSFISKY